MSDSLRFSPKPLVEDHYHVKELIELQEKRACDREYSRLVKKERSELDNDIAQAKTVELMDFWCCKCKKDFKAVAQKQVEVDWSNTAQNVAFYKTKCFKGHWAIRHITDKHSDGYWGRSKFVALDRGRHGTDLLQPFEEGYNLLFGKPKI